MREVMLSVVMTTFNHERYIATAIESVLRQQTDFPLEIVIGEDCSADRTLNSVLQYAPCVRRQMWGGGQTTAVPSPQRVAAT